MVKERTYRVTLARVASIAGTIHRLRVPLSLLGVIAVVWFVITLAGSAPSSRAMLPLTLLLWCMLGLGIGHLLARLPASVRSGDRLVRRIRQRLLLAIYSASAALMLVLAGFAVFLTLRTVGLATA